MADMRNESRNSSDNSPLIAAYSGSMDFLVPFLKAGGPASYANDHGDTLLHAAADGWQYRMIEFLILSGAQVNAQNLDGDTPLHFVTSRCEPSSEGMFIAGCDCADARSRTFGVLLLRGAEARIINNRGETPLHLAAWGGDLEAINVLANHSAIDDLTAKGASALMLAVLNGHVSCTKRLLEFGANADMALASGRRVSDIIRSSPNPRMRVLLDPP